MFNRDLGADSFKFSFKLPIKFSGFSRIKKNCVRIAGCGRNSFYCPVKKLFLRKRLFIKTIFKRLPDVPKKLKINALIINKCWNRYTLRGSIFLGFARGILRNLLRSNQKPK